MRDTHPTTWPRFQTLKRMLYRGQGRSHFILLRGHDHRFGHPVWLPVSQQIQNNGLQAESSAEFSVLAETMIMAQLFRVENCMDENHKLRMIRLFLILRWTTPLGSTAGCGRPHVRWCGRGNGRNPVTPTRSMGMSQGGRAQNVPQIPCRSGELSGNAGAFARPASLTARMQS